MFQDRLVDYLKNLMDDNLENIDKELLEVILISSIKKIEHLEEENLKLKSLLRSMAPDIPL